MEYHTQYTGITTALALNYQIDEIITKIALYHWSFAYNLMKWNKLIGKKTNI